MISICARKASSASDKSTVLGDFQAYPLFKPMGQYQQYAIVLITSDPTVSPSFTGATMSGDLLHGQDLTPYLLPLLALIVTGLIFVIYLRKKRRRNYY